MRGFDFGRAISRVNLILRLRIRIKTRLMARIGPSIPRGPSFVIEFSLIEIQNRSGLAVMVVMVAMPPTRQKRLIADRKKLLAAKAAAKTP